MRRQRIARPANQVELFPFLSILACTIGTLILLIIVITTQTYSGDQEVTILANEQGGNQAKSPRYIESSADGVIIYPGKEFVPAGQLAQPDSAFAQLLTDIKSSGGREYLIVAVRPNGVEVFKEVRDLIEAQEIDIGYEPIDQDWQLKVQE